MKGIVTTDRMLITDVKEIESAVFPLPICTIKLEVTPPGHAAMTTKPTATSGETKP